MHTSSCNAVLAVVFSPKHHGERLSFLLNVEYPVTNQFQNRKVVNDAETDLWVVVQLCQGRNGHDLWDATELQGMEREWKTEREMTSNERM